MKKYAIVLAAGLGTRMKSDLPKCAYPLLNKPMIEYIVDNLERSNVDEIICVIGHKGNIIKSILKNRVTYVVQEVQLGTAHAVLQALSVMNDGISIIIPGDVPLVDSSIIQTLFNYNNDLTIATMNISNPSGYGRIVKLNNKVVKIVEDKEASKEELLINEVNTGLMVIKNDLLKKYIPLIKNNNSKNEYYLTDIIFLLNGYNVNSHLILDDYKLTGINDLYSLSKLETILIDNINNGHLLNGVNIINKNSVVISIDTIIESGVTIHPNTILYGKNIIKKNSEIGPNTQITNSIINENVKINSSCIYNSIINENTIIGPFAHIKQNSEIGMNNRIGNFVEIKNSKTDNKVNAVHLSYIGDATIGNNVNFGCGSITVNYDGKTKSKTIIEDNVFIGCNSNLIAPLLIESNSFIAAATTVTKNVSSGDLVIGRVKQVNKKGYFVK